MDDDELYVYAKEIRAPVELVRQTKHLGRLPVVNFAAGKRNIDAMKEKGGTRAAIPCRWRSCDDCLGAGAFSFRGPLEIRVVGHTLSLHKQTATYRVRNGFKT